MRICIDDWVFEVDLPFTKEYSERELSEHCTCGYCRNFYETVDDVYPDLRGFLEQFGVQIHAPEELMPYEMDDGIFCEMHYSVAGCILLSGSKPIIVDSLEITAEPAAIFANRVQKDSFDLHVRFAELPWVLQEPLSEVVSPVNDNSLWERILRKNNIEDKPVS